MSIILTLIQACRQDIAAGGDKNQKEGPKTRRGGAHFNNTVLDVCSNQGAKREMEGYIFQMGGPDTTAPPAGHGPPLMAVLLKYRCSVLERSLCFGKFLVGCGSSAF